MIFHFNRSLNRGETQHFEAERVGSSCGAKRRMVKRSLLCMDKIGLHRVHMRRYVWLQLYCWPIYSPLPQWQKDGTFCHNWLAKPSTSHHANRLEFSSHPWYLQMLFIELLDAPDVVFEAHGQSGTSPVFFYIFIIPVA